MFWVRPELEHLMTRPPAQNLQCAGQTVRSCSAETGTEHLKHSNIHPCGCVKSKAFSEWSGAVFFNEASLIFEEDFKSSVYGLCTMVSPGGAQRGAVQMIKIHPAFWWGSFWLRSSSPCKDISMRLFSR